MTHRTPPGSYASWKLPVRQHREIAGSARIPRTHSAHATRILGRRFLAVALVGAGRPARMLTLSLKRTGAACATTRTRASASWASNEVQQKIMERIMRFISRTSRTGRAEARSVSKTYDFKAATAERGNRGQLIGQIPGIQPAERSQGFPTKALRADLPTGNSRAGEPRLWSSVILHLRSPGGSLAGWVCPPCQESAP